jgi:hypothetical protein
LLREFNVSVEKLAWLVMASFVLLSSPMLFAPKTERERYYIEAGREKSKIALLGME